MALQNQQQTVIPAPGAYPSGDLQVMLAVKAYLVCWDQVQAAIEAGVPKSRAKRWSDKVFKDRRVEDYIARIQAERARRLSLSADTLDTAVKHIALADYSQAFDDEGNALPIHRIPPHLVNAMIIKKHASGAISWTFQDRLAAIRTLYQRQGLLAEGGGLDVDKMIASCQTAEELNIVAALVERMNPSLPQQPGMMALPTGGEMKQKVDL